MFKRPSVSIIVPVYNVAQYLDQCITSIINQTLKDIEIIIIDDGSTDQSPQIVDSYAKRDPRITVVHQKNSGYSTAVNKGINLAHGYYIGIVESDDFIELNMYEKLYTLGSKNDADIVKGGFYKYNSLLPKGRQDQYFYCPSGIDLRKAPKKSFSVEQWPEIIAFHSSIWSSIYKSDLIKKCQIPESAGASYQDLPFMLNIMSKATSIVVTPTAFYHWRNDPGQKHSTNVSGKKALLMIKNSEVGINIIKKTGKFDKLKEALYTHILWTNIPFLYNIEEKYKKIYSKKLYLLLKPVKEDKTFQYKYFQKTDKVFFRLIMSDNYPLIRASLFLMGVRRKMKRIFTR